jgi:hypothetical protein
VSLSAAGVGRALLTAVIAAPTISVATSPNVDGHMKPIEV